MITPEYMPPEVLKISESIIDDGSYTKSEILADETHPWSVDIWSLGCILTEIVIGIPLWLSLKCKNEIGRKTII
jgi:dual specificity tyrosine-phosphorylation-regulated kinase 2/3/4